MTCHTTSEISDYIPRSLVEKDKYIEVAYGYFITAKQTGEAQIKKRDDNGKPFIATSYNVLFAPDLCDQLSSIITLTNLGHTRLFHKGPCMVFFISN